MHQTRCWFNSFAKTATGLLTYFQGQYKVKSNADALKKGNVLRKSMFGREMHGTFSRVFAMRRRLVGGWIGRKDSAWSSQQQLDTGYPESNEDSWIKEMFDVSVDMSSVRRTFIPDIFLHQCCQHSFHNFSVMRRKSTPDKKKHTHTTHARKNTHRKTHTHTQT